MYKPGGRIINPVIRNDPEWYCCKCGQKLFKIRPGAVVRGVQIKCKRCKEIINITIEP